MGKITKVKTESYEEWKDLRSKYIGGSDAAAVVGLNPFRSAYALWAEKTGKVEGFDGNLATEVGTYLEDFVAKKFEEVTGKKVRNSNQSFFNSDYPWAIANIDREIVGEDAGLEIKTTDSLNLKKFKGGDFPATYYAQMIHYLAVTGKKCWYLAVLVGNKEFLWFTVERDEDEINALMEAEASLWENIQSDTPPDVDGRESTTDAISAIYEGTDDTVVDLYAYQQDLETYFHLKKQAKELEYLMAETLNRIKDFMGECTGGECESYKVTWRPSSRKTFDYKAFIADHPHIDTNRYFKESVTRTFRVSEIKE